MDLVTSVVNPATQILPSAIKVDNLAQTIVVGWYLYNYTPLDNMEIATALGINSLIHYALHESSCHLQG